MGRAPCTHREGTLVSNNRKTLDAGAQTHLDCALPTAAARENRHERSFSSDLFTGKIKTYHAHGEEGGSQGADRACGTSTHVREGRQQTGKQDNVSVPKTMKK